MCWNWAQSCNMELRCKYSNILRRLNDRLHAARGRASSFRISNSQTSFGTLLSCSNNVNAPIKKIIKFLVPVFLNVASLHLIKHSVLMNPMNYQQKPKQVYIKSKAIPRIRVAWLVDTAPLQNHYIYLHIIFQSTIYKSSYLRTETHFENVWHILIAQSPINSIP
jgi:hypothetical protein